MELRRSNRDDARTAALEDHDTLATLRALNDLDLGALAFFATHTDPHILWELTQARRSLARPAAIPVTLAVVSPPEPRCWPNVLPGGTSRRRAQAAEWRATWARWLAADDGR